MKIAFQLEPSQAALEWLWMEKYEETLQAMVETFNSGRHRRAPWHLVPAGRVARLWRDYQRLGFVRDVKALDRIADSVVDNIVKLAINTAISGHSEADPAAVLTDYELDDIEPFVAWAVDLESGGWRITDYGFPRLGRLAALIHDAETPEETLVYLDLVFNVTHQRSDLAAWFIEGGSGALDSLFDEAGAAAAFSRLAA